MSFKDNIFIVDVEATGLTPFSGYMTEFGVVHFSSRKTYHGILWDAIPDPECPAKPLITSEVPYPHRPVFEGLRSWLSALSDNPSFVSDNPAYDFMWMAYYLDEELGENPFGYSARRISDFYAGLSGEWKNTQKWKKFRKTPHTHNPVDDAMGNVEALEYIFDNLTN